MALVVSVASCKGGVGKSMLSHLFAITLAGAPINKKVLLIDSSNSKTVSYLSVLNNQNTYEVMSAVVSEIPALLSAVASNYDVIFLDLPSNIQSAEVKKALVCCDQVVVPVSAEISAQLGCKITVEALGEVSKLRTAAGFDTVIKVLANGIQQQKDGADLYALLQNQAVVHFEHSIIYNKDFGYNFNKSIAMMDYVTQGVAWSQAQDIFHSVFIEFHESIN